MWKSVRKIIRSEFFKNLFTLISATSVAQAIALAIYPVLSRIYTPAEHGLFALYMSIIALTSLISTGKYELAVMIPKKDKEGFSLTVLSILLSFLFSIFLCLVIAVAGSFIPSWLGNGEIGKWLWFIPLSTFMIGVFQSLSYWNNRRKWFRLIARGNLSQSLINSTVKLSTSSALPSGGGLISGAIAGQFAGLTVYLSRFFKVEKDRIKSFSFKDMHKVAGKYRFFPKYNMPHYVTNNFSSSLPVFMFSSAFSPTEVGLYSLGFMMINRPMNLVTNSFTQVLSQRVIEKYNHQEPVFHEIKFIIFRLFLIALLPFFMAGIWGPAVFSFVFGEEWLEAGVYMRLLLPWLFVVFLSSPLSFLPDMLSRQKKAMWIDVIKFFLRIIVLYIGVKMNNIYIAIALFSAISFILVSYNLFWYVNLSALADKKSSLKSAEINSN